MSHYTCLVVGDDVAKLIQPFHEFECTGENDEFVVDVDQTAELQARINEDEPLEDVLSYYGLADATVVSQDEVDTAGAHKFGYAIVADGKLVKAVNRTNPNKKWDWWAVGGRWPNFLLLKNGNRCDSARAGDVDFAKMRELAEAEAGATYDKAAAAIAGREIVSWQSMRERFPNDIDAAREEYHAQPAVRDFKSAFDDRLSLFGPSAEEFTIQRDEYVSSRGAKGIATFAVLKDGIWHERGDMGWFGMVAGEKEPQAWGAEFARLTADIPAETRLTIVDCHI